VIEKLARQARAMSQRDLVLQRLCRVTAREIQRLSWPHLAGYAVLRDQALQSVHRMEARPDATCRVLEAVELSEFGQRAVYLPQQHRRACRG